MLDTPPKDECALRGWNGSQTILMCYQEPRGARCVVQAADVWGGTVGLRQ
jgi:hypothetical protein